MTKDERHSEYDRLYRIIKCIFNLSDKDDRFTKRQAIDVNFQKYLMEVLDKRLKKSRKNKNEIINEFSLELKNKISKEYTGSILNLGISYEALRKKYAKWQLLGKKEKPNFRRYKSLIKNKSYFIKRLGLNRDVVSYFFKHESNMENWCSQNKVSIVQMKSILARRTKFKGDIAHKLKSDIKALTVSLQKNRKEKKEK